jgi:hypothetical protein
MSGPLNSSVPTTSQIVGGVFNETTPAPIDKQACALQLDNEGNLLVNARNPLPVAGPLMVEGLAASNTPFIGNPVQMGSVFGGLVSEVAAVGDVVALQCDPLGSLYVDATGREYTYRACQSAFAPLADPSVPFVVLQGSATKTVKIRHVKVTWACTTGNAAPNVIRLRRYTVISGGTPNFMTPAPLDINNPTATAVCDQYSVLPTTATPYNAGSISSEYMQWTTNSAGLVGPVAVQLDFGVDNCQALTLHGTSDFIGIEISAVAAAGSLMTVRITWTES